MTLKEKLAAFPWTQIEEDGEELAPILLKIIEQFAPGAAATHVAAGSPTEPGK